jgi:pyruvate formate lyase activating enzyme
MNGKIFNIQKFCTSDGPGIRTTVFFKGCPLKCVWCHNPESQNRCNEIMYNSEKCIGCQRCERVCKNKCHVITKDSHIYNRDNCVGCGSCVGCEALEISGYEISSDDVLKEVLKDKPFYDNSGGGITLSGGEPLYQIDFCLDLLKKSKENGLHVCMETCGFASSENIIKTADFVDIYLFDIKETNAENHLKFTGVDNKLILQNLKMLDSLGKKIILRCPIIPGYNDTDGHFEGIGKLASSLDNVLQIEVEPYHSFGEDKYSRLGRAHATVRCPSNEEADGFVQKIQKATSVKTKISL